MQSPPRRRRLWSVLLLASVFALVWLGTACEMSEPPVGDRASGFGLSLHFPPDKADLADSVAVHAMIFTLGTEASAAFTQRPRWGDPDFTDADSSLGGEPIVLGVPEIAEPTWYRVLTRTPQYQGQATFALAPGAGRQDVAVVMTPAAALTDSVAVQGRIASTALAVPAEDPADTSAGLFPIQVENLASIAGLELTFMATSALGAEVLLDPGSRLFDLGDPDSVLVQLRLIDAAVPAEPIYNLRVAARTASGALEAIPGGADILFYLMAPDRGLPSGLCLLPGSVRFLALDGDLSLPLALDTDPQACPWAPRAHRDTATVALDEVRVDVLANDIDHDGALDVGSLAVTAGPANGTVLWVGDGLIAYAPDPGFVGIDSLRYRVRDDRGNLSNPGRVRLQVLERPEAECTVTPDTLDFGVVDLGQSAVDTLVIAHSGVAGELGGLVDLAGCGPEYTVEQGIGSYLLAPGEEHVVVVRFTPTAERDEVCAIDPGTAACGEVVMRGRGRDPVCTMAVTAPVADSAVHLEGTFEVTWTASDACGELVDIWLRQWGYYVAPIADSTPNDGSYEWFVDGDWGAEGNDAYTVVVMNRDTEQLFESEEFAIGPPFLATPDLLDFGAVEVGQATELSLELRNLVDAPLALSLVSSSQMIGFSPASEVVLEPLGSATVQVVLTASDNGNLGSWISVYSQQTEQYLGDIRWQAVGYWAYGCELFLEDAAGWDWRVAGCWPEGCETVLAHGLDQVWVDDTTAYTTPGQDQNPGDGSVVLTLPPGPELIDPDPSFTSWAWEAWSGDLSDDFDWQQAYGMSLAFFVDLQGGDIPGVELRLLVRDDISGEPQWYTYQAGVDPGGWLTASWSWWELTFPEIYTIEQVVVAVSGEITGNYVGQVFIDNVCPMTGTQADGEPSATVRGRP